ncbi:MAG: chaperone modulator CbpM [Thioalkalispiraceae bacterium]|jgi:chaperone modulatory protein CbpM
MKRESLTLLTGEIIEEEVELSLAELCRTCQLSAEQVFELVEYGLVEPRGREPTRWRFQGSCIKRVHGALRLKRDLGVNIAGAALAIDLLEELEELRARLRRFEER